MQMTAAVSFTLCSVDRHGSSKDLSGSTAELTARAAPAINISGNNNQGCLFFPKLSVSMTDLFWKQLFWQISGVWQWLLPVCVLCACWCVSATCAVMKLTCCECTRCTAEAGVTPQLHVFAWFSSKCLTFHKSAQFITSLYLSEMDKYRNWW